MKGKTIDAVIRICRFIFGPLIRHKMVLPEDLNLRRLETDCMLWMAIQPEVKYPLCGHPAVSHAAGSAVAALVTHAVGREIRDLKDRFNVCGRDMLAEEEFTQDKLEDHLYELVELKECLEAIGGRSSSDLGGRGVVSRVFVNLKDGKNIVLAQIADVQKAVEAKMAIMQELSDKISASRKKSWEKEIIDIFKKVGKELQDLERKELGQILGDTTSLGQRIRTDWNRDLDALWSAIGCEPRKKRLCQCLQKE